MRMARERGRDIDRPEQVQSINRYNKMGFKRPALLVLPLPVFTAELATPSDKTLDHSGLAFLDGTMA